ncbi:MAG: RnfH family protein [Gammaproteobacteria bacterium]|jgi:putative ubiquitin-RnfH superfamily antitoxin RatB of RatAB toxin-antitoxin module
MATPDRDRLQIEIAYAAAAGEAVVIPLQVPPGTTVEEAIRRSGILEQFPSLDPGENGVGIFARPVALDAVLADGDRIEIYRPLRADPKEARRRRASRQKGRGR